MAYSALIQGHIQQTAARVRRFEAFHGESFQRLPNYHYIDAPIEVLVEKKIIDAVRALPPQHSRSGLVQIWGITKTNSKIHLLTTTGQAFALYGNNQELEEYRRGCLHQKLYVYEDSKEEKGAAFGLPGLAFLNRTHEQTQNMHDYPEDQRPPCNVSIFDRKWGSYAILVFDADKYHCVLEFVLDTPMASYNDDILAVYNALQYAGLQSSVQINHQKTFKMICGHEKKRNTKTSDVTKYSSLVPYMGLSKAIAAEKLGQASADKKAFKETTFRNLLKNVGIPEWPRIRITTARAASVSETQMNQIVSDTNSYVPPSFNLTSISGEGTAALTTGDIEALVAYPSYGVKHQDSNAPIPEDTDTMDVIRDFIHSEEGMNIDHPNDNYMDLDSNNIFWDKEFHEQPWRKFYDAIPSAQETRPGQSAFETGGDMVDEDFDPLAFIDLDSIDWLIDETK